MNRVRNLTTRTDADFLDGIANACLAAIVEGNHWLAAHYARNAASFAVSTGMIGALVIAAP